MNAETMPVAGLLPDSTYVDIDNLPWVKTRFPGVEAPHPQGARGIEFLAVLVQSHYLASSLGGEGAQRVDEGYLRRSVTKK